METTTSGHCVSNYAGEVRAGRRQSRRSLHNGLLTSDVSASCRTVQLLNPMFLGTCDRAEVPVGS